MRYRKGLRQTSRRIYFSEKHFCQSSSAFHSVKPVPHEGMCLGNPGHFHRRAGEHYHNGIRHSLKKLLNQLILCVWKLHIRAVMSLKILEMVLSANENNGVIISLCCFLHSLSAVCILLLQNFRGNAAILSHGTAAVFQAIRLPVGFGIHVVKIIRIISRHKIYLRISAKEHFDSKKRRNLIKCFNLCASAAIGLDAVCIVSDYQDLCCFVLGKRKLVLIIFQKNDGFPGCIKYFLTMLRSVIGAWLAGYFSDS